MLNVIKWFAIAVGVFSAVAYANDQELYDPEPPEGSSFVRVIFAGEQEEHQLGAISFSKEQGVISSYKVIQKGSYAFDTNEAQSLELESGQYYTILAAEKPKLIQDEQIQNPAKSKIYFYNLTDRDDASLFAPKHKTAIVEKVAALSAKSREINAVGLELEARIGDNPVQKFEETILKRRIGTSVAVTGEAGNYHAVITENQLER